MIDANPALNPLVSCSVRSCLANVFVVFAIPVAFVKSTWLQTIGLANHGFRNASMEGSSRRF